MILPSQHTAQKGGVQALWRGEAALDLRDRDLVLRGRAQQGEPPRHRAEDVGGEVTQVGVSVGVPAHVAVRLRVMMGVVAVHGGHGRVRCGATRVALEGVPVRVGVTGGARGGRGRGGRGGGVFAATPSES